MDEARDVLERLDRIERLEREGARADAVIAEVCLLIVSAERWLRAEPAPPRAAAAALDAARDALDHGRRRCRTLVA